MAKRPKKDGKSSPGGLPFGNRHVKFVGDASEASSLSEAGAKKFVPNQRLDWLHDGYQPPAEPVDLRRLSSGSTLDWVWWCCLKCHRENYGVRWWALVGKDGCTHDPHDKNQRSFASWCRDMGLTLPRGPKAQPVNEDDNPWT